MKIANQIIVFGAANVTPMSGLVIESLRTQGFAFSSLRKYLEKLWYKMVRYLPTLLGLLAPGKEKANGIIFSH